MGVLDMALAITLIAGVAMEAQFLPATYGPCEEAANWNNGTDGRNFFVVAGATERFEYKGDDASGICRNLMANWATTIAVMCVAFFQHSLEMSGDGLADSETQHLIYPLRNPQHDLRLPRQKGKPIRQFYEA